MSSEKKYTIPLMTKVLQKRNTLYGATFTTLHRALLSLSSVKTSKSCSGYSQTSSRRRGAALNAALAQLAVDAAAMGLDKWPNRYFLTIFNRT
jgi:hypothetical protein